MDDLTERLDGVRAGIDKALSAVQGDGGASPVLVAVVREFQTKGEKAAQAAQSGAGRDAVIELEQAGDSAKAAAEADGGLSEPTRQAVLDAHLAICKLKFKM